MFAAFTGRCLTTAALGLALTMPAMAQSIDRVVVFGDSLSDGGFFPAVSPPGVFTDGAGSFTTNPDPVAPEVFASNIGLSVETAYSAGGVPDAGFNYAIGGARISRANPLGSPAIISIERQIDVFVASGRSLGDNDVVYIQGGGNDLFNVGDTSGTSPDAGNFPLFLAQAGVLAEQVVRLDALGAGTIVTMNVQSAGNPFTQQFNATYEAALAASGVNTLFFDTDALFDEIIADATLNAGGVFGITNITGQACTTASSVTCNESTLVSPDANETFALADSVHPTGIVQRIQGQAIASLLTASDQIGELPYAAQALMRSHRDQGPRAFGGDGASDPTSSSAAFLPGGSGDIRAYLNVGGHFYDSDPSGSLTGVNESSFITSLGIEAPIDTTFSAGLYAAYSIGEGDFDGNGGGYDVEAWSATGYIRADLDRGRLTLDGTLGRVDYDDLTRNVVLGPALRQQEGDTEATYGAIRLQGEYDAFQSGGVTFGPEAALAYESLDVDGFSDNASSSGPTSTDIAFGSQDIDSFSGRLGVFASGDLGATALGAISFYGRVSLEHEFDDGDRSITITPAGAPVSFTRDVREADQTYLSFEADMTVAVSENLDVTAGVSGFAFRNDTTSVTGKVGIAFRF